MVEITLVFPVIAMRVADRIIISEKGMITEQENHFDASPVEGVKKVFFSFKTSIHNVVNWK